MALLTIDLPEDDYVYKLNWNYLKVKNSYTLIIWGSPWRQSDDKVEHAIRPVELKQGYSVHDLAKEIFNMPHWNNFTFELKPLPKRLKAKYKKLIKEALDGAEIKTGE